MSKEKKKLTLKTAIYYVVIFIATIVLDRISKQLVLKYISKGEIVKCIPGVFHLTYLENKGAAFGMLANNRWVFMVFSVVAIALMIWYIIKDNPQSMWVKTSLGLLLGGGIGNMIDRVFRGSVTDFIDFEFVRFYVFNIADACVTVGCAILIVYVICESVKEKKKSAPEEKSDNE